MKYIKYFESVNTDFVVDLLKSYGFYSVKEINSLLEDSLLELKDIVQYYNDSIEDTFISLEQDINQINYYFDGSKFNSNILENNQIIVIESENIEVLTNFRKLVESKFKILKTTEWKNRTRFLVNLIPDNLAYYTKYKYTSERKIEGVAYEIESLFKLYNNHNTRSITNQKFIKYHCSIFQNSKFSNSTEFTSSIVNDISIRLHKFRSSYNMNLSHDGQKISIRITPNV